MNVTYDDKKLNIGGKVVETPWPIREAFSIEGNVIVLMDQFADLKGPVLDIREVRKIPKGRNLFCYSLNGSVLWQAEFPTSSMEDYYYSISSRSPLVVNSFSSYRCEIDPQNGKIIRKEFFK